MCAACVDVGNYRHDEVAFRSLAGGADATKAVIKAVESGLLPKPTSHTCADCEKPATVYDHRDYNKPLDVTPVCNSCNNIRGPAIPLHGSIKKIVGFGFVPYASMRRVAQLFASLRLDTTLLDRLPKKRLDHAAWVSLLPAFDQSPRETMQDTPISIAEMCAAAADLFAVSEKFLMVEPYLAPAQA